MFSFANFYKPMKILLTRLFVTNWKTTLGSLALLVGMALWALSKITTEQFIGLMGVAGTWIGLNAKDGVREDTVVAREDVPGPDANQPPTPQGHPAE